MDDPGREAVAAMVGGAGGAVMISALVRAGVAPRPAALAVAVGGGLSALALDGTARQVAIGAAAACLGQLALMWLEAPRATERQTSREAAEAFARARRAGHEEEAPATQPEGERPAAVIEVPAPGPKRREAGGARQRVDARTARAHAGGESWRMEERGREAPSNVRMAGVNREHLQRG